MVSFGASFWIEPEAFVYRDVSLLSTFVSLQSSTRVKLFLGSPCSLPFPILGNWVGRLPPIVVEGPTEMFH